MTPMHATSTRLAERRARERLAAGLVATLFLALAGPASAQLDHHLSLGVTGGHVDIDTVDEPRDLSGFVYGIEGTVSPHSRLYLTGEYRQGWLGAGSEGGPGRRVFSAQGALGVRILPWIMIEGGPRLATIELPLEDRKVLRWRIGIVGRAPLVPDLVSGYASAAGSFAGTGINGFEVPGGGGEVGLVVQPTPTFWARLAYRFDREYLPLGSSQTFQSALLTVGVSAPRIRNEGSTR